MKCPLCDKELSVDKHRKWILCESKLHKYKLTDYDDETRKSVNLKILSDSVLALKNGLEQEGIDDINKALLNGQMHAYQMLADYMRDDDYRDYEELKGSKA